MEQLANIKKISPKRMNNGELVHPKIISGNSNITLSKGIASWASSLSRSQIDLVEGRVKQFNDQEILWKFLKM